MALAIHRFRRFTKPSLCQRVNQIDLSIPWNADMELMVYIMKKVMGRNIKIIINNGPTGLEIYGLLLEIARESELKLAKVEIVPTSSEFGKLYYQVLRIFKKSLSA